MKKSNHFPGNLYLVGTPIGNLSDLSPRALDLISQAKQIICESPHRSRVVIELSLANPDKILKLTEHTKPEAIADMLAYAKNGLTVYMSDAGMPCVSDPGASLVAQAHELGLNVGVVPGPSAVLSALALSGYTETSFKFVGFLPQKITAREKDLNALYIEGGVVICFESPQRIRETLQLMDRLWGLAQEVFVVKEITKLYERYWRGTPASILQDWGDSLIKGEFVIVLNLEAAPVQAEDSDELLRWIEAMRDSEVSLRTAVNVLVKATALGKNVLYKKVSAVYSLQ